MKRLVETNLDSIGAKDFRDIYTPEVKKGMLDYAHGKDGSTPKAEQNYVYEKFRASVDELPDEITVLPKYDIDAYLCKGYNRIFVDAKNGSDENSGSESAPVATIHKALSLSRAGEPTAICIHAGEYSIPDTLYIGKELSGTPDTPFIFTSIGDGEVLISATKSLLRSDFSPIEDTDEIANRIPDSAKGKVLFADVKKLGWTREDIGEVTTNRLPILYIDGVRQDVARYPNNNGNLFNLLFFENVAETGSVTAQNGSRLYSGWIARVKHYVERKAFIEGKAKEPDWDVIYTCVGHQRHLYESKQAAIADYEKLAAREAEGYAPYTDKFGNINMDLGFSVRLEPNFHAQADWHITESDIASLAEWKSIRDGKVMVFGNAYEGWDYDYYQVRSIEKREDGYYLTTVGGSAHGASQSGNSPTGHNNLYIYNAPEAIDTAGEWYMDEKNGRLYVYPTENFDKAKIEYGSKLCDLMNIEADNVIINGVSFDKGSKQGIMAADAEGVVVQNCRLTNMASTAVTYKNCSHSAVIYNDFKYNRTTSVSVGARTLAMKGIPACNIIQNNHVDHPIGTQAGIGIGGWRNCVSHNVLDLSQITLGGDGTLENIIEYNDVRGGHTDTSDAGLIYVCMYSTRGTHIRYNHLHNWHAPGCGVYLDDLNSGNYIYCNIIDTTEATARDPKKAKSKNFIYTSSGHDHVIHNNLCIGRSKVLEQHNRPDGSTYMKEHTGVIRSRLGERNPDGTFPVTVEILGKTYTIDTEEHDRRTHKSYHAMLKPDGYKSAELWYTRTTSDDEGDNVLLTFEKEDGSIVQNTNYNDRIFQSWMYFSDKCHLGYRFRGCADIFLETYSAYMTEGSVFERRFPEVYTYMELFREYVSERDNEGYTPTPLELFIRSAAMNRVSDNVILGVPIGLEKGSVAAPATGRDENGNPIELWETDTMVDCGNFDKQCDGYEQIAAMVEEYQDKEKPCSYDFCDIVKAAEEIQTKRNPSYKPIAFVLDRVGFTK